jgi:hypothetical protein
MPKVDNIQTQDIPYGPDLPSDPSTPTNTHSGATSTPSISSDSISIIFDKSEGTPNAHEISLAEGDMNVDPCLDLPALHGVSDSESEDWDCLIEREETDSLPHQAPASDSESESADEGELRWSELEEEESEDDDGFVIQKVADKGDKPRTSKYDTAFVAGITGSSNRNTEIYDSGASRHITPYKERFINYEPIVRDFKSVDHGNFQAIGKRGMLLKVLGSQNTTLEVLLKDVLYSPQVGVTLIAISKVAQHGRSVVFTERYGKVLSSKGKVLGNSPEHAMGAKGGEEKVVVEKVTVDDFDRINAPADHPWHQR